MSSFAETSNTTSTKKASSGSKSSKASKPCATATAPVVDAKTHEDVARWGFNIENTEELEDWASEWQEVLNGNGVWGGRTRGGRGVQRITGRTKDISVEGVTLAFCGKELLTRTSIKFVHKHRYGIIGENGVGKSTLLRRIAKRTLPGIPLHFRIGYVQQELPLVEGDIQVLDYIMKGVHASNSCLVEKLEELREQEKELDEQMEVSECDEVPTFADSFSLLSLENQR